MSNFPQTCAPEYMQPQKQIRPELSERIKNRLVNLNKEVADLTKLLELLQGQPDLVETIKLLERVQI